MKAAVREGAERNDRCYVRVFSGGKWKLKQRYLWEQRHGAIPEGHCICFLDGDQRNFNDDNMVLVTRAVSTSVGKTLGTCRTPELTMAQILLYQLEHAVKEARA